MKYTVNTYGWSMEALGKSLTDEQVQLIKEKMVEKGYDETSEIRFEVEDFMEFDHWDGDLFHVSKAIDNQTLHFEIEDENGEKVVAFGIEDISRPYDEDGNEKYEYDEFSAWPNEETSTNIWLTIDESKGGVFTYEIESEDVPKPEDFSYSFGCVSTPEGDWDYINNIYFKGQELEIVDFLDNTGKAATIEIFTLEDI
jgi:hypothetical protein